MGDPNLLSISRAALSQYGSLEPTIRAIRAHNPLDLSAENWRQANPGKTHADWRAIVRRHVREHLHFDAGPTELAARTISRTDRGAFVLEEVEFNLTPWTRVPASFLVPHQAQQGPVPGLVVLHAWGGPMVWGRERVVNLGRDHHLLREHREKLYSGNYLAEEFARRGYAVVVIDAHHFGRRIPFGLAGVPAAFDPFELSSFEIHRIQEALVGQFYFGMRELAWAGTTWMGLLFWDDMRCIDFLQSRPEVRADRIGVTGVSGGGWRTNVLAALDERIRASASVCWMTCGDYQQIYSVQNTVGVFTVLPGVWNRMDVPDLTIMAAPGASMVINAERDLHFPVEAQREAARRVRAGYEWAGVPERFCDVSFDKPHCYDVDMQARALAWFDRHLMAES